MNVDELTLLRRLAGDEPAAADAARAEVWRRLSGGELQASDRRPDGRTRLPSRRVVAIAAMIVVAGLLVAPAVAIGDHFLELISGKSARGDVQTPAWSPDGRKLAFVSERDGNSEIYVMNVDGSAQENLTEQPASDSHPSWSRDGRRIVFVSRRDGNAEIYVMNADGSGLRNLTRTPSADRDPAWSPDGRAIAFVQRVHAEARRAVGCDVPLRRQCRWKWAAATDDKQEACVQSKLVGGREDHPVRGVSRVRRRQREQKAA